MSINLVATGCHGSVLAQRNPTSKYFPVAASLPRAAQRIAKWLLSQEPPLVTTLFSHQNRIILFTLTWVRFVPVGYPFPYVTCHICATIRAISFLRTMLAHRFCTVCRPILIEVTQFIIRLIVTPGIRFPIYPPCCFSPTTLLLLVSGCLALLL